jgi:hypothetical protein
MQSNQPIVSGHEINFAQSTVNAAGGNIYNTYGVNLSTEEILATLKPVERPGHTNKCMPGTREDVLKEINYWLDDFSNDSKVMSLLSES